MGPVLAWAVHHDLEIAARLVTALSEWWLLRGRLEGQQPLLRELAGRAGRAARRGARRSSGLPGRRPTRPTCPGRCSGATRSSR